MFNENGEPKVFTEQKSDEKEVKKKDKTVILVVILMAVILVGLVILYNFILNDTFNKPTPPQTTTNAGFRTTTTRSTTTTLITDAPVITTTAVPVSTTTSTTKPAQIEYPIKISNMVKGDVKDFQLGGGQVLQVKMKKIEDGKFEFEMLFNGKKFCTQKLTRKQDIKVYLMGNTLIYINMEKGNEDYKHMYIMRETKLQKVYEFESTKGMVPDTFAIQDNKFIVYASRVQDDGKSIRYGTAVGINICDESTWSLDFTKSSVIKATYTYTLTNKRLSEQPIYNNPVRVDTYLASGACN